jgi:hypothetical protein
MKNKNRPRREKQRKRPGTKRGKPFNPWIAKYFNMTGECDNDSKRISAPGLQDGQAHQDTARQG